MADFVEYPSVDHHHTKQQQQRATAVPLRGVRAMILRPQFPSTSPALDCIPPTRWLYKMFSGRNDLLIIGDNSLRVEKWPIREYYFRSWTVGRG
ncbi:hypothetical protein T4E_3680 [Trichinella pseudospiralis]|uniref:Uncharacterized protein n=1 Tax=Trichinella pseudospiralis TaxID=6337 RepID=A0A0V0X0C5_TRIPS|nr:hypothetical protein T4E_3680 [Trichinella pseudospiralis]